MLLSLLFCGLAFERVNHAWLILGTAVCAMAFCTKLQAGMLMPVVGMLLLMTKQVRVIAGSTFVFGLVCLLAYLPFLVNGDREYLKRVFVASFQYGRVTQINAYNAWGLWYQLPTSTRVLGISAWGHRAYCLPCDRGIFSPCPLGHMAGQRCQTRCHAPLCHFRRLPLRQPVFIAHPNARTLSCNRDPAGGLAGYLDRRLLVAGIGFSLTYALNMLAVGMDLWKPWGDLSPSSQYFEPVKLLFIVNRVFCSALNVVLFLWLTLRLHRLLATSREGCPPDRKSLLNQCPSCPVSNAFHDFAVNFNVSASDDGWIITFAHECGCIR